MSTVCAFVAARQAALQHLYRFSDAGIVAGCGVAAAELIFPQGMSGAAPVHGFITALCTVTTLLVFPACGLYKSWRGRSRAAQLLRTLAAWGAVCFLGVAAAYLLHQSAALSRLWYMSWLLSVAVALPASRIALYCMLDSARKAGINAKRVVILGYGSLGDEMYQRVRSNRGAGYNVVGIYDEGTRPVPAGVMRLESLEHVCAFVRSNGVHEIWLTLPMAACRDLYSVVSHFRNDLIDIRWVPDIMSVELLGHRFGEFLGLPVIDLNSPTMSGITGVLKASFDRVFAVVALIGLAPLLLVLAALVKLSSRGPVLSRQAHLGMDGQPFRLYGFRTMEQRKEASGITRVVRGDARVTSVGGFMRRTGLDKLPQLFNVLRGDMSVVGPRPHAIEHAELYKGIVDRYMLCHRVRPGITGWEQINSLGGQTDAMETMRRRVEFDIFYIRNWSFRLDLHIILHSLLH
ncbi:undecaprenyl-phosphate glucose phosphotransferase [Cupriavidus basilensis]|uniref:Undecaprenyl-phosphate glucose phosphotransferase n=1 Tax=Cupriavidus basilensis TaxID=68895 RepID=A0ABT6B0B7_9BURK|nr:undecaprenyl-phosphate glucose phosphotransferase [Cupriavidus basilensis]MDF3838326.1 undecaprenyl-phosphate glucose phosphotransferase [Cupriavidus basilensis]